MNAEQLNSQPVWDPMVRIGHWALAVFFGIAYWMGGDRLNLHAHSGYTVALLIGFRTYWGFAGPSRARFDDFVVPPKQVLDYLRRLVTNNATHRVPSYLGHDPAGAVMIVVMLSALAVTVCSGMVLFAMESRGPVPRSWVADWSGAAVETIHHTAADATLIIVALHILGVLVMSVLAKQNLIAAMIHGHKKRRCSGAE